jgi:hypothetical protein
MKFIRLRGENPAIRPRLSGQTILVCAVALLLGLIGLAGCGSSSGNSPSNGVNAAAGSPSPSCAQSSFVRRGHKSLAAGLPVLVSAQITGDDIPVPDFSSIDEGVPSADLSPLDARNAAGNAQTDLNSPPDELFQGYVQETEGNLQEEANGVGLTEEAALLTDYANSGESASDFGQAVCNMVGYLKSIFSSLENVSQIDSYLQQQGTQTSNDVESGVDTAVKYFTQVFGPCIDSLSVAEWMLEDIDSFWCE